MRTININTLKQYVEYLAAKDISGGYLPPAEFNTVVPILVNKIVRKYYGLPEEYQPGNPQPRIAYEITQLVTDYISQLKVPKYLNVNSAGQAVRPEDYMHLSSLSVTWATLVDEPEVEIIDGNCCSVDGLKTQQKAKADREKKAYSLTWNPVTIVPEKDRWAWLTSSLRRPTKQFPISTFLGNDIIQFYPTSISAANLTYLRYPLTAVWGFTNINGIPTYNAGTSVNVELPDICMDELAVTVLERLGIAIREKGLIDFSRYIKQTGT